MNIIHKPENRRFETTEEGYTAFVSYEIKDGGLDIRHTVVPEQIGGKGIAAALVKAAYDYARDNHLKPVATCAFAVKWLQKHPEYEGCTGCDYSGEGCCAI